MESFVVTPIGRSSQEELVCPSCAAVVLVIRDDRCEVPGGGYWLDDGDTVPCAAHECVSDQFNFWATLFVGHCSACWRPYYAFECVVMRGREPDLVDFMLGNEPAMWEAHGMCTPGPSNSALLPKAWLLTDEATAAGLRQSHTFGPFALASKSDVVGPFGVTAPGYDSDDGSPWGHARRVVDQLVSEMQVHFKVREEVLNAGACAIR